MAISMLAAYSSGETALVVVSTATSISARPLGSRNWTTGMPTANASCGGSTGVQSAGAAMVKRPCGSRTVDVFAAIAPLVDTGAGAPARAVASRSAACATADANAVG